METETWKDIKGFEGQYQVSDLGKIKSLDRLLYKNNGHDGKFFFKIKGTHLKPSFGATGYHSVMLSNGSNRKRMSIHRIIAMAFIPNPNNYPQVNHKNDIKTDNRIENLEWCTCSQNVKHAFLIGLNKVLNTNTGIFYESMLEASRSIGRCKSYFTNNFKKHGFIKISERTSK